MTRISLTLLLCCLSIVTALNAASMPTDPKLLDSYLRAAESTFDDLTPGTEKTISWAGTSGNRTPYSVVYLHGYSATRQETAPFTKRLSAELGANAFFTRLTGHGRPGAAMLGGSVDKWTNDAREAYEIGALIGQKVIVVSVSTGGTLATWLAAQPFAVDIAAMVLISPNFDVPDQRVYRLDWPLGIGVKLGEWMSGEQYSWQPSTELHARYWTHQYPIAALRPMVQLLKLVQSVDKSTIKTPALFIYSPRDRVVLPRAVVQAHDTFGSDIKQLIGYTRSTDPSQHVLAGDILSPTSTDELVGYSLRFLARTNICASCSD